MRNVFWGVLDFCKRKKKNACIVSKHECRDSENHLLKLNEIM